jgi:mRNA interferase HigB
LHVISRKKLVEAARQYRDAEEQLDAWYRTAKMADWKSLVDVRKMYAHADGVKVKELVYTVFNICGNKYRLIAEVFYRDRTILIRHVLTHADYDKGEWKK